MTQDNFGKSTSEVPAAKGLADNSNDKIKSVKVYSVKNDVSIPDMLNKYIVSFKHHEFPSMMMDKGQIIFESNSELSCVPVDKADGICCNLRYKSSDSSRIYNF